jgi:hypothetical protein
LTDNSDEEKKLLPFANIAIAFAGSGSTSSDEYTVIPTNGSFSKRPSTDPGFFIFNLGGGIIYKLNNKTGIRLSTAYHIIPHIFSNKSSSFLVVPSHPSINIGFRFKIAKNEKE